MTTPLPWPAQMTAVAGAEIKRQRGLRKMSAKQLAEKVTDLGFKFTTDQVVNLERTRSRRATITNGELVAFGAALGVPPAMLMFPIGHGEVEYLPGRNVDAWHAYRWFTGLGADSLTEDIEPQADEVATKLNAFRNHDIAVMDLSLLASTRYEDDEEEEIRRRRYADKLETLLARRETIRARGWTPPPVPLDIHRDVERAEEAAR